MRHQDSGHAHASSLHAPKPVDPHHHPSRQTQQSVPAEPQSDDTQDSEAACAAEAEAEADPCRRPNSHRQQQDSHAQQNTDTPIGNHTEHLKNQQGPSLRPAISEPTSIPPHTVFSRGRIALILFFIALAGFFSPVNSNIYFPVIPQIANDLHRSVQDINLTVTIYLVFQGISPSFVASLSDIYGRRIVYLISLSVYLLSNIGLALQRNYLALMLLRITQSCGASSCIALGAGVVSDISTPDQRGRRMSYFQMGTMMGPSFAPLIGGVVGEYAHWPTIFWLLTGLSALAFISILFFLPETLRIMVGNGSIPARGLSMALWDRVLKMSHRAPRREEGPVNALKPQETFEQHHRPSMRDVLDRVVKPFKMLKEPDIALLLLYNSLSYTLYYCITSSASTLFKQHYHLDYAQIGLAYLGIGMGTMVGTLGAGRLLDHDFRSYRDKILRERAQETGDTFANLLKQMQKSKLATDLDWFPIEACRTRNQFVFTPLLVASGIAMGWTFQAGVHISAPILFQFMFGVLQVGVMSTSSVLMIDLYPSEAASATSANNLVRCLMGAGGLAVIDPIIKNLGPGYGFSMLCLIVLATLPILIILRAKGPQWRRNRAGRHNKLEPEQSIDQ